MKVKELIEILSGLPNQDSNIWVYVGPKQHLPIECVGRRWVIMEGKPPEKGDDDVSIYPEGVYYD